MLKVNAEFWSYFKAAHFLFDAVINKKPLNALKKKPCPIVHFLTVKVRFSILISFWLAMTREP